MKEKRNSLENMFSIKNEIQKKSHPLENMFSINNKIQKKLSRKYVFNKEWKTKEVPPSGKYVFNK